GYHHNPFDAKKALESFDPKKDVVIIGTRKTAIDVSLRLFTEEKLEGKVTMVSHNGLMPSIYAKQFINQPLQYLHDYIGSVDGQLSLDALLPLFWKELSNVQGTNVTLASVAKSYKDISALDWLNQQIEECDRTLKPWQQVLVSIFPLIPTIWRRLSVTDQETFLKKYYSLFMAYAAGFPQDAAKEVRKLIEEDRLDVRGGLTKISATEDGQFEVQFENGDNLTTSQLFNATGAGYDISSLPVYRNMCEQGLIVAH
uniref:FAD-dependent oxidoreductase n=1 Tax=Plectus sambesii TaxID=2011161 RepID=A0A914VJV2_9BILA